MFLRHFRLPPATVAALLVAITSAGADSVTRYDGVLGSPAVPAAFTNATACQSKQFIDFDNDGFVLPTNGSTPIPSNYYASQGVTLLNLAARSVGTSPWSHSPPIGAWHTGFDAPITTPYSFVFASPVASVGMFFNDLELRLNVTLHLVAQDDQTFSIAPQGGANVGQFHGFAASSNVIQSIDFFSTDYHIIDDVQFGAFVPLPATLPAGAALLVFAAAYAWRRRHNVR